MRRDVSRQIWGMRLLEKIEVGMVSKETNLVEELTRVEMI